MAKRGRPTKCISHIYTLKDGVGNVRYVGQTINPTRRQWQHRSWSNNTTERHVCKWIRSLLADGKQPVFSIIETTTEPDDRERYWVAHFREAGCDLLNMNEGGNTLSHTNEAKAANPWSGKLSPLQRRLSSMRRTATYFNARGLVEDARQIEDMLSVLRTKLKNPATKKRVNNALFAQYGY